MTAARVIGMRWAALIAVCLLSAAPPAFARIKRTRPSASSTAAVPGAQPSIWTPFYSLILGGGVEYQSDDEQTEYGFPILIEYHFSERIALTIEPMFASIRGRKPGVRSVSGFGDLETTLDYEFLRERRYRPALSVEGKIRWPTAADRDLGNRGRDYTLGLIASKDLVLMEVDLNVLYTFTGDREREDTVEISLAAGWHMNRRVDLIAEVSHVQWVGHLRGSGTGGQSETEGTVGLAWRVNEFLKFEQGVVFKEHGLREVVFAWEWSFGGE